LKYSPDTIEMANDAFCKFFGIDKMSFKNGPIHLTDFSINIGYQDRIAINENIFKTGEPYFGIVTIKNTFGEDRTLQIKKKPKKNGVVKYLVCTAIDMTHYYKIQNALLKKSEEMQTIYDISFASIFISENGKCINHNSTVEKMFGYSLEESIGKHGTEYIAEKDREIVKEKMMTGSEEAYQVTALRKDGTTFPCEIQGRTFTHYNKPYRMTVVRDLTERKKVECN